MTESFAAAVWAAGVEVSEAGVIRTARLKTCGEGIAELAQSGQPETTHLRAKGLEPALAQALGALDDWSLAGILLPPGTRFSGAALAVATGRDIVWDFNAADQRFGGMGGAEDAFFHHALLRFLGCQVPAAVLDLGPIARLTWADPRRADPTQPGACLAFDAGPGCTMDEAGLAETGQIAGALPELMLQHPFFSRSPPRRLIELAELTALTSGLVPADAATTRAAMTAAAVVQGLELCPELPRTILVCGAGRHHPLLIRMIAAGSGVTLRIAEELGIDGDLIRAQAAAFLAVRARRGLPTTASGTTGVQAAVGGAEYAAPNTVRAGATSRLLESASTPLA